MDIQTDSNGCPVGVTCPMDGFQTDCPFLWTEKCPHWHPIGTNDDLKNQRKQTNYEKFNDAMCRLRQAEEDLHKALQDVYAIIGIDTEDKISHEYLIRTIKENRS